VIDSRYSPYASDGFIVPGKISGSTGYQSNLIGGNPPVMLGDDSESALRDSAMKPDGLNNGKPVTSSAAANDNFQYINNNLRQTAGNADDHSGAAVTAKALWAKIQSL
jgi:hypothetical protein